MSTAGPKLCPLNPVLSCGGKTTGNDFICEKCKDARPQVLTNTVNGDEKYEKMADKIRDMNTKAKWERFICPTESTSSLFRFDRRILELRKAVVNDGEPGFALRSTTRAYFASGVLGPNKVIKYCPMSNHVYKELAYCNVAFEEIQAFEASKQCDNSLPNDLTELFGPCWEDIEMVYQGTDDKEAYEKLVEEVFGSDGHLRKAWKVKVNPDPEKFLALPPKVCLYSPTTGPPLPK
ncbi:hypothetical protein K458DRAFT_384317 [Lentithecium fluviatile CBS 122367]|uniref:Uncharacterized protein n=1 Tax=Lentithecium fluviatile CBS 122367 TaxID=1168545 RepID=A0A6G1JGL1_9PLEO|nr:hypothetical protein K458DRAFT_384317 [Lentithecium fluviatile CBS 122367]